MTDARLRELERRWKESGSVEAEADYLTALARAGGIDREGLEVCAHLGHAPAAWALGTQPPEQLEAPWPDRMRDHRAFFEWADTFCRWGGQVISRVALAAAEEVLPLWEAWALPRAEPNTWRFNPDRAQAPRQALEATRTWIVTGEGTDKELKTLQYEVEEAVRHARTVGSVDDQRSEFPSANAAGWAVATPYLSLGLERAIREAFYAIMLDTGVSTFESDPADPRLAAASGRILEAIRTQVVPWALGRGDPVGLEFGSEM